MVVNGRSQTVDGGVVACRPGGDLMVPASVRIIFNGYCCWLLRPMLLDSGLWVVGGPSKTDARSNRCLRGWLSRGNLMGFTSVRVYVLMAAAADAGLWSRSCRWSFEDWPSFAAVIFHCHCPGSKLMGSASVWSLDVVRLKWLFGGGSCRVVIMRLDYSDWLRGALSGGEVSAFMPLLAWCQGLSRWPASCPTGKCASLILCSDWVQLRLSTSPPHRNFPYWTQPFALRAWMRCLSSIGEIRTNYVITT
jgi:hypothetical protein